LVGVDGTVGCLKIIVIVVVSVVVCVYNHVTHLNIKFPDKLFFGQDISGQALLDKIFLDMLF